MGGKRGEEKDVQGTWMEDTGYTIYQLFVLKTASTSQDPCKVYHTLRSVSGYLSVCPSCV